VNMANLRGYYEKQADQGITMVGPLTLAQTKSARPSFRSRWTTGVDGRMPTSSARAEDQLPPRASTEIRALGHGTLSPAGKRDSKAELKVESRSAAIDIVDWRAAAGG